MESGFLKATSSTCIVFHPTRHVLVLVHGNDSVSIGDGDGSSVVQSSAWNSFEITSATIGHDVGDKKQVKVLNRIITVTLTGF